MQPRKSPFWVRVTKVAPGACSSGKAELWCQGLAEAVGDRGPRQAKQDRAEFRRRVHGR